MSITNDVLTIAGNIGNDPVANETRSGKAVINFRVATSSGYFDQRTGAWVDGGTNWYAVSAFGKLAEHAKASLHCGDPVIVVGRLRQKEWEANGKKGIDVELTADSIGHDLRRGTSAFARRPRPEQAGVAPAADDAPVLDEPTEADRDAWAGAGLRLTDEPDSVEASGDPRDDALTPA
ncbi:single-stranded DNA-binding protein [Microbacterium sp.]|uniref:single-stranded DNA-binding protein n=1 Tax=Microbacterium sp. TaxID=51671 RepID=UPI0028B0F798|nr:single-stranded DNA-binding protein [Microbacterium sp.]